MSTAVVAEDVGRHAPESTAPAVSAKRTRSRAAFWTGVTIIAIVALATIVAHVAQLGHPNQIDLTDPLAKPSLAHPFGTDGLGRDVFVRSIYGSGLDLEVGLLTTALPLGIGMILGLISGYFGGWPDTVIMRLMDALLAFPFIVLIISFVTIFGVGLTGVYVGLTVATVPYFARLTRGEMLVLREQQFMMAARTLGYSSRRIIFKHALPHLVRPNLVFVPSNILLNILTVAALSYLGLGVQPPQAEWGAIIGEGQQYLLNAWWVSTLPGLFVVVVGIGFSLMGEGLAEQLRLRAG